MLALPFILTAWRLFLQIVWSLALFCIADIVSLAEFQIGEVSYRYPK